MVLPLYLAMNAVELKASTPPCHMAWMACHFSSSGCGISNLPDRLPEKAMLILNDRIPCQGHSANLIVSQVMDAVSRFDCESVLLDLQRPDNPETEILTQALVDSLPCPVAVSDCYAHDLSCPVFLSPAPLHVPLREHLRPWKGREIWLEAALCQETVTVTETGSDWCPCFPPEDLCGGFFDPDLCCHYHTHILSEVITFALFDTPESLEKKLNLAHSLGVSRAVGLYQELGSFPDRKV